MARRCPCTGATPQSSSIRYDVEHEIPRCEPYLRAAVVDEAMLSCFRPQGFGTLLMEEAERIAREEHGSVKLAVISGMYFPPIPV